MKPFEILFDAARPTLWSLALTLTFGNTHDAEDLLQDCAKNAWASFARYDEAQSFEKWAACLLHNAYKNALRTTARARTVTVGLADAKEFEGMDPSTFTEECFATCDAIDRLPEEHRDSILRIVAGEPTEDRHDSVARWVARRSLREALL